MVVAAALEVAGVGRNPARKGAAARVVWAGIPAGDGVGPAVGGEARVEGRGANSGVVLVDGDEARLAGT